MPVLLDLFCGGGGAAMGYHRAGFDVVGVDINPQPRYPFAFIEADAMEVLRDHDLSGYHAIHASPPCQRYSYGVRNKDRHPDLLGEVRDLLNMTLLPWVIENVPGAPMRADYVLCGSQFELPGLRRHRLFETSWHGFELVQPCVHTDKVVSVCGHGIPSWNRELWDYPTCSEYNKLSQNAMGIDWLSRGLLSEAVPPAYTEFIGRRLMDVVANGVQEQLL